jgi:hypothetical protein
MRMQQTTQVSLQDVEIELLLHTIGSAGTGEPKCHQQRKEHGFPVGSTMRDNLYNG